MKNITFINAGAGSGKTYRLTEELFKAINKGQCKANEVLLTTFTKMAAEEIKVKAREKLLKENLTADANQLQNAFIGTIHSVGSQIIQKFWHYIGLPKEIMVMDENDTNFYFNQAIANIPTDNELGTLNKINYRFSPRNSDGFYEPDQWKYDLLKIIELARTNHITDFNESQTKSLKSLKLLLNTNNNEIDLKRIENAIQEIINILNRLPEKGNKSRKKHVKFLNSTDRTNISYSDLYKIKGIIDDLINKNYDEGKLSLAANTLENIQKSKNLIEDLRVYNELLFSLARRSIDEYAKYKKELGIIDYSDMENSFLQLLDFHEVQTELKSTIKLVLVDEFQDSSPIQLAIFIKLSEIVNKSIWVGDPKQSIYGFRGTDPQLIDSIIKHFEAGKVEGLKTDNLPNSWRSRPGIVNLVNNIFKLALRNQVKEETISLKPVRTDKGFDDALSIHHFNFIEAKATNENYYSALAKGVAKLLREEWIIGDKNRSRPDVDSSKEKVVNKKLKPCDIAILCKTNKTVEIISENLMGLGISVASEISGLELTAEYQLIIALAKLLQTKENTLAKAQIKILTEDKFLTKDLIDDRSKFLSNLPEYPVKEEVGNLTNDYEYNFSETTYNEELISYYSLLNKWGEENFLINNLTDILEDLIELSVPQLIEQLINRLNLYTIVSKWGNSEQRRGNLQKLIDYANKYDERCLVMNLGSSLSGFMNYIEQHDDKKESKANNEYAVNVLTYHKSKGLEWPVVMLADFHNNINWAFISREVFGIRIQNDVDIDLNNVLSNRTINLFPWVFGAPNSMISEEFKSHIESLHMYKDYEDRSKSELKRLMYVGMTRPRDYLITTGIKGKKEYPWIDMVNKHNNWNFAKSTTEIDDSVADVFDCGIGVNFQNLQLDEVQPLRDESEAIYFKNKRFKKGHEPIPFFISPSSAVNKSEVNVSLHKDVQGRIPLSASINGKEDVLGNCLHDILYLYIGFKLNSTHNDIEDSISNIIDNHALKTTIETREAINAIDNFFNFLKSEFNPEKWYRELALETKIDEQLYKGEADLLLETNKGYVLIDYKSYPGDIKQVLNSAKSNYAGKYAGQLDTYTKMIETITGKKVLGKFIYYTVLGKLIKIDS